MTNNPQVLAVCNDPLAWLYATYFPEKEKPAADPPKPPPAGGIPESDAERLDRIRRSKQGAKFARLYDRGDTSEYGGDDSRADAALCMIMAGWLDKDAARVDAAFRASALMRPKWDERHGAETYGERTVRKAIENAAWTYEPKTRKAAEPRVRASDDGDDGDDGLAPGKNADLNRVEVSTAEHRTNDAAVKALATSANLYQRGQLLVKLVERPAEAARPGHAVSRPAGPCILTHDANTIREELTRRATFFKRKVNNDGEESESSVHPPAWCANTVIRRKYWPGVPELTAIVSYPVVLADGRVLASPGYDPGSGIYLHGDFGELDIPEHPTQDDARDAAVVLADVYCDFPFEADYHKAAAVSMVLTPLARYGYTGPTPMHLAEANTRGSGKTLLMDVTAAIVTGGDFARTSYSTDKGEVRKLITAFVVEGYPLVLFDNVTGKFGDASLDAALTGTVWSDRVLGGSTIYTGPLTACFYATGNNFDLAGDMGRRVIPSRIVTRDEHPEDRNNFKYDLPGYATQNRAKLLSAALTMLKAYILAGKPAVTGEDGRVLKAFGGYAGWSGLVRSALVWSGLADPARGKDQLREEADRGAIAMRGLLEELQSRDPNERGITAREVAKKAAGDEVAAGWETVADMLTALEAGNAAKVGYLFRHYKGRILGGRYLDHASGKKGNTGQRWVVRTQPVEDGKGNNSRGDPSSPSSQGECRRGAESSAVTPPPAHRHFPAGGRNTLKDNGFWVDEQSDCDDGDDGLPRKKTAADASDDGDDAEPAPVRDTPPPPSRFFKHMSELGGPNPPGYRPWPARDGAAPTVSDHAISGRSEEGEL